MVEQPSRPPFIGLKGAFEQFLLTGSKRSSVLISQNDPKSRKRAIWGLWVTDRDDSIDSLIQSIGIV